MMSTWTDANQIFGIEEKQKCSPANSLTEETCRTSREHRKRIGQRWHCKFTLSEMERSARDTNHSTKLWNQNLRRHDWSKLTTLNFFPQTERIWTILDEDSLNCFKSWCSLIRSVEVLGQVSFGSLIEHEFFMRREYIIGLQFEYSRTDHLLIGIPLEIKNWDSKAICPMWNHTFRATIEIQAGDTWQRVNLLFIIYQLLLFGKKIKRTIMKNDFDFDISMRW